MAYKISKVIEGGPHQDKPWCAMVCMSNDRNRSIASIDEQGFEVKGVIVGFRNRNQAVIAADRWKIQVIHAS